MGKYNNQILICAITVICAFSYVDKVNAGNCSVQVKPATVCNEDSSKNVGYFSDPSLSTIKNSNCSAFITSLDKDYCTSYCREESVVNYPSTINPMSVDKYQPILGGTHFKWEKTSIITKRECTTEINYAQWEKDYEALEKQKKEVTLQLLREWHQLKSDKVIGKCTILVGYEKAEEEVATLPYVYADPTPPSTACQTGAQAVKIDGKLKCKSGGGCPTYVDRQEVDDNNVLRCYVEQKVPINVSGKLHQYTKVTYNDSTPRLDISATYCDALGTKPYWDTGQIDKYWSDVYQTLVNNINSMVSRLRKCNEVANIRYDASPSVTVNYTDPTKNYTTTNGKKIKLDTKIESSDITKSNVVKAPNIGSGLLKVNCRELSGPADAASVDSLYNACTTTYTSEYNDIRNESISKEITNKYSYKMPSNIFRYSLKSNGEAVDSNSSKVTDYIKQNHSYIDIGYPNYPVHYTTPTGEYPIYLEYSNLGTNGYFTKMLGGTGRYDCTYKVVNLEDRTDNPCNPDDETCEIPTKPSGGNGSAGDPTPANGLSVIYRPISLTDPFPAYNGKRRTAGENWTKSDIKDYITNNRGTTENSVYNKGPIYSFTLDAKAIRAIRTYNDGRDNGTSKKRDYNDFDLTCGSGDYNGKRCQSKFLKQIKTLVGTGNATGSCLGASFGNFYSCANKPNQDKIKCGLNTKGKYVCTDCAKAENSGLAVCKKGSES